MNPFDVARAAEALSRPGIDPRTWCTLAVVTSVHTSTRGVYCGITTMAGIVETAQLAPPYSGSGYGFYTPVEVGDVVTVFVPEGDWAAGARVLGQNWDAGTPAPPELEDHPEDVALIVKPGRTVRIITSGGGDVVIEARGSGKVKLGSEGADRGVARAGDTVALTPALGPVAMAELQVVLDARYAVANPTANLPAGAVIGSIKSASSRVASD